MRRAQDARDRMSDDTQIGGPSGRFPPTRWSAIVAARGDDPAERTRAFETIVAAYWKPVYKYIRARWGKANEDAKDLTQEFFARVMEKGFLDSYDPAKSRLRTFLRTCVDGFVANQDKAARRIKRGGDAVLMSLDFQTAEGELARSEPPAPGTMEEFFEKEWIRNLFSLAVERLRAECEARGKAIHFRLFELYDLEGESRLTYERSEEHTSELQSPCNLVCRLLLEKKKKNTLGFTYNHRPRAGALSPHWSSSTSTISSRLFASGFLAT